MADEKLIFDYRQPPEPTSEQQNSDYYTFGREAQPVRPRRTLAAILALGASTVGADCLLIVLIYLRHLLSGQTVSEATCAIIGWICNGTILVVGLILLPTISRKSGGSYMGLYLLSAIGFPIAGMVIDFVTTILLVSKWMC